MAQGPRPRLTQDIQTTLRGLLAAPQSSGGGLLSSPLPAPQRERVSGWRVLDRVLGGQTVSAGLDSERERLQAEAMRPQMLQRAAEQRAAAERMGPAALLAYDLNPEKFGENLSEQYAPRTTSSGGRTDIMGTGQTVSAPSFSTVNDTIYRNEPMTGASIPTATAPPAFTDLVADKNANTAAFNAQNPVLAANSTWVGPDGRVRAQGYIAPNVTTLQPGGEALITDPAGNVSNRVASSQQRPMTAMDRNRVREDQDAVEALTAINTQLGGFLEQVRADELRLGPVTNAIGGLRNWSGRSSQNSRNYASFMAGLEKMRNDSLRLNNGVQTEGDSQRAWNELLANVNDEGVVMQRLAEIQAINERAIEYRRARIEDTRGEFGGGAPSQSGPVTVRTPAEAAALPPGTRYRNPSGQEFVR